MRLWERPPQDNQDIFGPKTPLLLHLDEEPLRALKAVLAAAAASSAFGDGLGPQKWYMTTAMRPERTLRKGGWAKNDIDKEREPDRPKDEGARTEWQGE